MIRKRGRPAKVDQSAFIGLLAVRPPLTFTEIGRQWQLPVSRERVRQLAKQLTGETAKDRSKLKPINFPIRGLFKAMFRWLRAEGIWHCWNCGCWFTNTTAKRPRACGSCNSEWSKQWIRDHGYNARHNAWNRTEEGKRWQRQYRRERYAAIKAGTWQPRRRSA